MEKERVQKYIALSGLASRRKAEELIKQNKVKINSIIAKLGDKCFSTDKIEVNNKKINFDIKRNKHIIINYKKNMLSNIL